MGGILDYARVSTGDQDAVRHQWNGHIAPDRRSDDRARSPETATLPVALFAAITALRGGRRVPGALPGATCSRCAPRRSAPHKSISVARAFLEALFSKAMHCDRLP